MGQEFFHVAPRIYGVGDVIQRTGISDFQANRAELAWVEELLEAERPEHAPSRGIAQFSFRSASYAQGYGSAETRSFTGQGDGLKRYLYRVEAEMPWPAPLVLVDFLRKAGRNALGREIAGEYWKRGENWKVIEFLSPKLVVLEIVELTGDPTPGALGWHYSLDAEKAMARWPDLRRLRNLR
jgi:hypothetical protein